MFSFYSVILDLIKARTHKYVRRIPVGGTKSGATKYRYFYHGQEGHGKGIAHESELVEGASFVFGEGENKYHAHITKVDGDMITVKHDDGAKKDTEHIYTKEQFQKLVHHEHRNALAQAKQKASKQLDEFQQMKERGAKVKQETLDKLQAQVDKLKFAEPKKQEASEEQVPSPKEATLDKIVARVSKLKELNSVASDMSDFKAIGAPGLHVPMSYHDILSDLNRFAHSSAKGTMTDLKNDLINDNLVSDSGSIEYHGLEGFLDAIEADSKEASKGFTVVVNKKWDKREKARWEDVLKPALKDAGLDRFDILSFDRGMVTYSLPVHVLNKTEQGATSFIKEYLSDDKLKDTEASSLTDDQKKIVAKCNQGSYHGFDSYVFEQDKVGTELTDDEIEGKDADNLRLYVEGTFNDKEKLRRLGFIFAEKKAGGKGISYYRFEKPLSQMTII